MIYEKRMVIIHKLQSFDNVDYDKTTESTVLFWNLSTSLKEIDFKYFIDKISDCYPLQLIVTGVIIDDLFDWMLYVLGYKFEESDPDDRHIMTGIIREEQAAKKITEFFDVILPFTDRIDTWHSYQVYLYGDEQKTNNIEKEILNWLYSQKSFVI